MIYKDFEKIDVDNVPGVCSAGKDTMALARCAEEIPSDTVLDVGTGTGFIAIYLAKKGRKCTATEVCDLAFRTACENFSKNDVQVSCIKSDLFENVGHIYDLIVFSTPLVAVSEKHSKIVRKIRKMLPRVASFFGNIAYYRVAEWRKNLLSRFIEGVEKYSNGKTHVVLLCHRKEVELFKKFNPTVCHALKYYDIITFKPKRGKND